MTNKVELGGIPDHGQGVNGPSKSKWKFWSVSKKTELKPETAASAKKVTSAGETPLTSKTSVAEGASKPQKSKPNIQVIVPSESEVLINAFIEEPAIATPSFGEKLTSIAKNKFQTSPSEAKASPGKGWVQAKEKLDQFKNKVVDKVEVGDIEKMKKIIDKMDANELGNVGKRLRQLEDKPELLGYWLDKLASIAVSPTVENPFGVNSESLEKIANAIEQWPEDTKMENAQLLTKGLGTNSAGRSGVQNDNLVKWLEKACIADSEDPDSVDPDSFIAREISDKIAMQVLETWDSIDTTCQRIQEKILSVVEGNIEEYESGIEEGHENIAWDRRMEPAARDFENYDNQIRSETRREQEAFIEKGYEGIAKRLLETERQERESDLFEEIYNDERIATADDASILLEEEADKIQNTVNETTRLLNAIKEDKKNLSKASSAKHKEELQTHLIQMRDEVQTQLSTVTTEYEKRLTENNQQYQSEIEAENTAYALQIEQEEGNQHLEAEHNRALAEINKKDAVRKKEIAAARLLDTKYLQQMSSLIDSAILIKPKGVILTPEAIHSTEGIIQALNSRKEMLETRIAGISKRTEVIYNQEKAMVIAKHPLKSQVLDSLNEVVACSRNLDKGSSPWKIAQLKHSIDALFTLKEKELNLQSPSENQLKALKQEKAQFLDHVTQLERFASNKQAFTDLANQIREIKGEKKSYALNAQEKETVAALREQVKAVVKEQEEAMVLFGLFAKRYELGGLKKTASNVYKDVHEVSMNLFDSVRDKEGSTAQKAEQAKKELETMKLSVSNKLTVLEKTQEKSPNNDVAQTIWELKGKLAEIDGVLKDYEIAIGIKRLSGKEMIKGSREQDFDTFYNSLKVATPYMSETIRRQIMFQYIQEDITRENGLLDVVQKGEDAELMKEWKKNLDAEQLNLEALLGVSRGMSVASFLSEEESPVSAEHTEEVRIETNAQRLELQQKIESSKNDMERLTSRRKELQEPIKKIGRLEDLKELQKIREEIASTGGTDKLKQRRNAIEQDFERSGISALDVDELQRIQNDIKSIIRLKEKHERVEHLANRVQKMEQQLQSSRSLLSQWDRTPAGDKKIAILDRLREVAYGEVPPDRSTPQGAEGSPSMGYEQAIAKKFSRELGQSYGQYRENWEALVSSPQKIQTVESPVAATTPSSAIKKFLQKTPKAAPKTEAVAVQEQPAPSSTPPTAPTPTPKKISTLKKLFSRKPEGPIS